MSIHIPAADIEARARVVPVPGAEAPAAAPRRGRRVFDMHPAVHGLTVAAYALFATILCATFMAPEMIVPAAIVAVSVVALFLTPGLWARVAPDDGKPKQSWAEFMDEGVDTITGRLTAGQAMAQILTLPILVVCLAAAMAAIKASL
jgi:multidrug efflux pump subunit AcrB